ncbi:MAG: 30S ribosomal protein S12 methylthiotransferase RimO [Oscillospiraceae bacterium]|nr:30S ribosomal protein S12 methylthiotransferase RimO [Candidatus Equicaccousia limihippi]
MSKIGLIALGCSKNTVDAEIMLAALKNAGYEITDREDEAECIIINTCGFLESAIREAIDMILEINTYKNEGALKAIIVTGCAAQRLKGEIRENMPEVDAVVTLGANGDIVNAVERALSGEKFDLIAQNTLLPLTGERILTTPPYTAYIKIAEGCSNNCAYCKIPSIRGPLRSRTVEDILSEIEALTKKGVKEFILIAQDTTRYGTDIYGEQKLPYLMREICKIDGVRWLRVLYTYPDSISDDLIAVFKEEPKVCKYFEMPIQHISDGVLKAMNRRTTSAQIKSVIEKIRAQIEEAVIRTTLMVGFPGESEQDFCELSQFVKDTRFDRLGVFAFSPEEGTAAAKMDGQIDEQTKQDRLDNIMQTQSLISSQKNAAKEGEIMTVLCEGYDNFVKCYYGRSCYDAPEVDGMIFIQSDKKLTVGEFYKVKITGSMEYDLLGELID